jgi:hypothetical protein
MSELLGALTNPALGPVVGNALTGSGKRCKNCGNGGSHNNQSQQGPGMAPVSVNPQGFDQAQLYGNQYVNQPKPDSSWWSGTPGYNTATPLKTPQQTYASNIASQAVTGLLQQGMQNNFAPDYSGFGPIAQRARSNFANDTLPSIATRFASGGKDSNLERSGYLAELGKAGAGLNEGLAAQESQWGQNQQQLRQNLIAQLLSGGGTQTFENVHTDPVNGFKQDAPQFIAALIKGLATLV